MQWAGPEPPSRDAMRMLGDVVAIIVAVLIGWQHYYPATPLIARLGLPGPRATTSRRCGNEYTVYRGIRVPIRQIDCRGSASNHGFWSQGEVDVDALTRRVTHVLRTFAPADSTRWSAERDSIRSAMASSGGRPIPCYAPYGKYPPWIVSNEAWRFRDYSVRLGTYHFAPPWLNAHGPPPWLLQLDGYPDDPPGCGADVPRPQPNVHVPR